MLYYIYKYITSCINFKMKRPYFENIKKKLNIIIDKKAWYFEIQDVLHFFFLAF